MTKTPPTQGGGNLVSDKMLMARPVSTVIVAYIAVPANPLFVHFATRFVETYKQFAGGAKHDLIVAVNGGPLAPKMLEIFDDIRPKILNRKNDDGWDISAYQDIARNNECDLIVCLGESVRFHRAGWLDRLVSSASEYGEGIYGCFSSLAISPHLNTTAFAVSPKFLKDYPLVRSKTGRYEFEHGAGAMWRKIRNNGGATKLVTWDGCYDPGDWRKPDNILWRGDQSNSLVFCNHTDNWTGRNEYVRKNWSDLADGLTTVKMT